MKDYILAACLAGLAAGAAPVLAWNDPGYYHEPPPRWYVPDQSLPVPGQPESGERIRVRIERGYYEGGYLLRVRTRGIRPDDIAVNAGPGRIRLYTVMESQQDSQDQYRRTRVSIYSRFSRTIRLPYDADPGRISTTVSDDMLEIRIPRRR